MTYGKQTAIMAGVALASTTAILAGYSVMARKQKKGVLVPALIGGLISAATTVGANMLGQYIAKKEAEAGGVSGLLGMHAAQRIGVLMPAPTVKKFSSFTGVRYYS
jgi:hypothetical protein